ncbi:MAG: ATPase [Lachnospiraceae bacterium]|nr:ATPase [Lachnospiraceae bacterium]
MEDRQAQIEKSIQKKFHKSLFSKFTKAIVKYELLKPGDKVAVCISGGKDSMLMAKLFQELQRHDKYPFELVFLCMDPGYSAPNRALIESNAALMGIPIRIFESDIFDSVDEVGGSPCYLCARMRRGHLYHQAQELGCNKIALGHHMDDVIETVLMGMLYAGQFQAMMPKLHSTNFEGMELIRPLYFVREEDIRHWCTYNDLHFLRCACHFTEQNQEVRASGDSDSKRLETKALIARLKETNPQVEKNLLKTTENVVMNKVLGYKFDGVKHDFLEYYEEKKI